MSLNDYLPLGVILFLGLFTGVMSVVITDCELFNFDDDCHPINESSVLVLLLISIFSMIIFILGIHLTSLILENKKKD